MHEVDPLSPTPLYEQIAAILREQIEAGELEPDRPIPSEASLQQQHDVARATVRRAVAMLRDEGWVFTVPQRGSYVAGPERRGESSE